MFASMGYGVYFFFASLMICASVFVFFLVPETKGIPLEAMDRLFSNDFPARRAHKAILAQIRLEDQEFRRNSIAEKGEGEQQEYVDTKHFEKV